MLKMKNRFKIVVLLLNLVVCMCSSKAQIYNISINWNNTERESNKTDRFPYLFDQISHYNEAGLPVWSAKIKLNSSLISNVFLTSEQYGEFTNNNNSNKFSSKTPNNINVSYSVAFEKKQPYLIVSLIPLKINQTNGSIEKLLSFSLNIKHSGSQANKMAFSQKNYTYSSVLATGNWYKVGVAKDGMYKIGYEDIKGLGLNPSDIDPKKIQLFGNGGGMLPRANKTFRHDDLAENAIQVEDGGDGQFDKSDYILFYGQDPNKWVYNDSLKTYNHVIHLYSDTTYYFLTFNNAIGKRISDASLTSSPPNYTTQYFDEHYYHDKELRNLIGSGEMWFGEIFDIQTHYDFSFDLKSFDASKPLTIKSKVAARSIESSSRFDISLNGSSLFSTVLISGTSTDIASNYAFDQIRSTSVPIPSSLITLSYNYSKPNPGSIGWLDYIELNYRRSLLVTGSEQLSFRDVLSVGNSRVSSFLVSANSNCKILDVSNPTSVKNIPYTRSGSIASFNINTDTLREFIVFSDNFYTPTILGIVPNQNLHAVSSQDMVIVSYPDFLSEAERLAEHHRRVDNLRVTVVEPQQVYNEFS